MKHLVSIKDLDIDSALSLLASSQELAIVNQRQVKKLPTLRGKTVVNLFYENSTRTRISFEIAAKRLSADVINFDASTSSLSKGESLKDTALTLEALGADAIVMRHPMSGAAQRLASSDWIRGSVINAGDGSHEHPTQALLDALTMQQRLDLGANFAGLKVLIVGDILHSRVARSNIFLLKLLGAEVSVAGPETLVPIEIAELGVTIHHDFDQALADRPNVVMMLRVQAERMSKDLFPSASSYVKFWSLGGHRLAGLGPEVVIMHPGPMNRGFEISAEAADDPRSAVLQQVTNGLAVRMAVLQTTLSGGN